MASAINLLKKIPNAIKFEGVGGRGVRPYAIKERKKGAASLIILDLGLMWYYPTPTPTVY